MKRRLFLATSISAALAGCSAIGTKLNDNRAFHSVLESAEELNERVIGARGMARLYAARDISQNFPIDSLDTPSDNEYASLRGSGFRSYRLPVVGAVALPSCFSLAQLCAMPLQTQITRHDCVEGWSAVAQWSGVRVADVLAIVQPRSDARFVVFHSFDSDSNGMPYYESLSLAQATHPQTLLVLRQNGAPVHVDRGAPVRLTVPLQLGYKSAKWIRRIEVVPSFGRHYGGKGGYWEDQGYEWFAGI